MTTTTITITGPHTPTTQGGLAYYKATCSDCSTVMRSSMQVGIRQDVANHERWHSRRRR